MLRLNGPLRVISVLCLFILIIVSFCSVQSVEASPEIIRVPTDYPTIEQAVNAANSGDTIIVSEGTYGEGEIQITKSNLTLVANGTVVVDGLGVAPRVFYLRDSNNVTIRGFTVINSQPGYQHAGICLDHAHNCNIENNTATNNENGILLHYSSHNALVNNTASLNDAYGIDFTASPNNTLTSNEMTDNFYDGIHLGGSYDNILTENLAKRNERSGISVIDSIGNILIGNIAINNTSAGLSIGGDGSSTMTGNNMTGNKYNLAVGGDMFGNEIDSTNFVDGKRVYYLKNQHDLTIDPSTFPDVGYLAVINSTRVTVRNITITNNWEGILFAYVTNSTIENVNVTRNEIGIHLLSSHRNTLQENIATKNTDQGIYLSNSRYNNISQNTATSNNEGIRIGSSHHNSISKNVATNSTSGIYLHSSDNNTIKGNTLANNIGDWGGGVALIISHNNTVCENTMVNNDWGVFIVGTTGNSVYHNNFIGNIQEAFSSDSTSVWDNGYPFGGNHWSDYNGADLYRSSFQNITGSDGVGDTPYIIPDLLIEEGQDSYPLMKPYGGSHDIGVIASVSKKTIIAEGYYSNVTMNVTVINYGLQTETFNFTSQMGATIQNQTLTLTSRNSTTLTFTLDTTGFIIGVYTLGAYVTSVPNETYTTDNTYTTPIIVTIPGDVDGDFDVDLYDAVKLLVVYSVKEGDEGYDPNLDINNNGEIFLYDAVILLNNYGQDYP